MLVMQVNAQWMKLLGLHSRLEHALLVTKQQY